MQLPPLPLIATDGFVEEVDSIGFGAVVVVVVVVVVMELLSLLTVVVLMVLVLLLSWMLRVRAGLGKWRR